MMDAISLYLNSMANVRIEWYRRANQEVCGLSDGLYQQEFLAKRIILSHWH